MTFPNMLVFIDVAEIGYECMEGIQLAQDSRQWPAVVDTVINLRVF